MGKFIIRRRKTSTAKKRRNLKHRSSRVKPKTLKRRAAVKQRIPVDDGGSTTPRTAPPQDQNVARNLADEFDDAADNSMMTLEGISANTRNVADQSMPYMVSESQIVWRNFRLLYHNVGAPAILVFYPSGRIAEEKWYLNDNLSRPGNLPVIVSYADREGSPFYSETFRFDTEYVDEDDEVIEDVYFYTRAYLDEDFTELDEPEEFFRDQDDFDVDPEDFEVYVGEGWRDRLVSARDLPRGSIPTLSGKTLSWKNRAALYDRRGGPAVLSFFDSGRLRSEKWYVNGVYQRDGNLPNYVSYRDNSSALTDRVEMEIWKFYNPAMPGTYGTISRRYNNQGVIEVTLYGTESGIGNSQIMFQEDWERIYGTRTLVSTIPPQQTAAPQAPPRITQPPNPTPDVPPTEEVMYPSGRVRSRVWRRPNGRYWRPLNYPTVVTYADNDAHTIESENWEIESAIDPDYKGRTSREYDMSGIIEASFYLLIFVSTGDAEEEFGDLESFLEALGRPAFNSERFGTYDYSIQGFQAPPPRVPVQQPPAPSACPREDINYVRGSRGDVDEVPKCKAIFTVDKPGDYPLGDILNNLYRECNFLEDKEIDNSYIATTVKYLQKKFPLPSKLDINTRSGKEVISAIPVRNTLSSFIPQVDTARGQLKVRYSDEPGIDYGGMARQFIENLMEKISYVLFDEMKMDTEPYVEILDGMTPEEKKKAMEEADQPRYYITKKSFREIADSLGMITTQDELNEILALHKKLVKNISESSALTMNVMETTDIMGALERVSGGMINYKKNYQRLLQNRRQRLEDDFSDFLTKELTEDKIIRAFPLFKPEEVYELYELAGNVFAYAAINKVPFKIPLSRILLKKMLNNNQGVSNEEKLAAYILDTGSTLSKDINLRFDYGGDDMEAIVEYMTDLENNLRESASEAYDVDELRLSSFISGFKKVGDVLRQRNFNINELNVMICKVKVTEEDMKKLLSRVKFTDFGNNSGLINKVKDAILNIGDYNQLLKWWTGSSVILDKQYEIQLTDLEDIFFNSHTCFFRFDVSRVIINSPNFLVNFKREITNVVTTAV